MFFICLLILRPLLSLIISTYFILTLLFFIFNTTFLYPCKFILFACTEGIFLCFVTISLLFHYIFITFLLRFYYVFISLFLGCLSMIRSLENFPIIEKKTSTIQVLSFSSIFTNFFIGSSLWFPTVFH